MDSNRDQIEQLIQSNRSRKKLLKQTGFDPALIFGSLCLVVSENVVSTDTTKALQKVLHRLSAIVSYTGLAANAVLSDVEKDAAVEKDTSLRE